MRFSASLDGRTVSHLSAFGATSHYAGHVMWVLAGQTQRIFPHIDSILLCMLLHYGIYLTNLMTSNCFEGSGNKQQI